MNDNLLGIVSLVLIFLGMILYLKKEIKSQNKKHLKNLEDDFLYDRDTGEKFKLEDFDSISYPKADLNRIKSIEEIKLNYSEEEVEIELAKNYIREKGFKILDISSQEEISKFENISWWEEYSSSSIDVIFKINDACYLYFVQVEYTVIGYKGGLNTYNETQLMIWLKNPTIKKIEYLKSLKNIVWLEYANQCFFKFSNNANTAGVKEILTCIEV